MYPYVLFLALLQASAPQAGVPLIDDCSDSATVLATLPADAAVEVRSSVAGNAKTCYAVTAMVGGRPVHGYVQGSSLDAVVEFERHRTAASAAVVNVAPAAPEPAPAVAATPSIPAEKIHYPAFPNFSAVDMKGKPVSVRSLKGKVNLVCFWSPANANASRELLLVSRLQSQFRQQGVDALGVSLSANSPQLKDTLEDYHLGFRNVPNGYDIAGKYDINFEALPRTYVLNENFEIVASGLHNKALEDLVKKLVDAR